MSERFTLRKALATGIGFVGILLALDLRASEDVSLLSAAAGLLGAFLGGALTVVVKQLSTTEPTIRMMLYPHVGVTLFFLGPALAHWHPISAGTAWLVVGMAVFGSISQWCFLTAYRLGDLSALAPVEYTRLVAAALFGYLIFAEVPTVTMTIGIGLVCLSVYAALSPRPTKDEVT